MIIEAKFVVICQRVSNGYFNVSGIAFFTIFSKINKFNFGIRSSGHIPHYFAKTNNTTMQMVRSIVYDQSISLAFEREFALTNTVGTTSANGSHVRTVAIDVFPDGIVALNHIGKVPSKPKHCKDFHMYTRNVSIHLKPNAGSEFRQTFEKDILPLAQYFLRRHAARYRKPHTAFSAEAGGLLMERRARWDRQRRASRKWPRLPPVSTLP